LSTILAVRAAGLKRKENAFRVACRNGCRNGPPARALLGRGRQLGLEPVPRRQGDRAPGLLGIPRAGGQSSGAFVPSAEAPFRWLCCCL
jgi:hypothetical protein